jgi:hypothetical protein
MALQLIECRDLGEALERLRAERAPQRWLYRGQTRRRPPHQISQQGQQFELENLYPQAFRFAAEYSAVSDEFLERANKEEAKAHAHFHAFNAFILSKYEAGRRDQSARFAWLDPYAEKLKQLYEGAGPSFFSGFHDAGIGPNNPEFITLSWSLAQHYGVVTSLLDLTWDPDVAAWFATNPWDAPAAPPVFSGHGILYRFDVQNLIGGILFYNEWLKSQDRSSPYEAPEDKAFAQTLTGIPGEFALRPARQQAAVVSGFHALHFHSLFRIGGKLEAFLFPHLPDQLDRWPLKHAREYLQPADDPFLDLKAEFEARWAPHAEKTFGVKLSIPVVILTDKGPRYLNVPDEEKDATLSAGRKRLYDAGMALLGSDPDQAEKQFEAIVSGGNGAQGRYYALAQLRLSVLRLLRDDHSGAVESLELALDAAQRYPGRDWVGQLLQSIAQGAQALFQKGEGGSVLGLLGRLITVAQKAKANGLALEAQLGAGVLRARIEAAQGRVQAALDSLAGVVEHPVAGMNSAERGWSAMAADLMAQVYGQLGDARTATKIYETILKAFGGDVDPAIAGILQRARRALGRG